MLNESPITLSKIVAELHNGRTGNLSGAALSFSLAVKISDQEKSHSHVEAHNPKAFSHLFEFMNDSRSGKYWCDGPQMMSARLGTTATTKQRQIHKTGMIVVPCTFH